MIVLCALRRERESILCYKKNKNVSVEYRAKKLRQIMIFFLDIFWDLLIIDFTNDYFKIMFKNREDFCMSVVLKSELSDTNI